MARGKQLIGQIIKGMGFGVHEGMIQEALMQQREKGGRIVGIASARCMPKHACLRKRCLVLLQLAASVSQK